MQSDGLCFKCMGRSLHIFHDDGTRNYVDEAEFVKENSPPTMEGDGYDVRDQEDE